MSPARSKRTAIPHRRSRADILKAAGVSAGIIATTALLIWLMRPGASGTVGTGGLVNRQPRSSWLIGGALGLGALATWFILRVSRPPRGREKVVLPVALGIVVVIAVAGGFAWPGGLLRHDHAPPPTTTTTTTTAPATTSTTAPVTTSTAKTSTSNAGGTTPTTAATTTTTPGTGTPSTTTPTTKGR